MDSKSEISNKVASEIENVITESNENISDNNIKNIEIENDDQVIKRPKIDCVSINNDAEISNYNTSINQDVCLVCMEGESDVKHIKEKHGCSQCVSTAWKICEDCDENLLSRTCPVCRSDYAPLVMHAVTELPLSAVLDPTISPQDKQRLLAMATLMKSLVSKINVAVWRPKESKMSFSLPNTSKDDTEINENGDTIQKVASCLVCDVELESDQILDNAFNFTNKIWDLLIDQTDAEGRDCETVTTGHALKFLFEATKSEGSILFTPLHPDSIQEIISNYVS